MAAFFASIKMYQLQVPCVCHIQIFSVDPVRPEFGATFERIPGGEWAWLAWLFGLQFLGKAGKILGATSTTLVSRWKLINSWEGTTKSGLFYTCFFFGSCGELKCSTTDLWNSQKTQNLMPPIPHVLFSCNPKTESENRVGIMLEAECLVAATIGFQLRKHRYVVFCD